MTETTYLYGKNPLQEALLATKRTKIPFIEKVFLTKLSEADPKIMSLIQTSSMSYDVVTSAEIEHMVGRDAVHQGVCARLNEKALYASLDDVLARAIESDKNTLFVLLDELQDPHNVGAIIRTAVAFGAKAILIPEHNQTHITGTVIKTSSGMNFSIPIVKIGNINTTLSKLKEKGFWTYALTGEGDTSLHTTVFDTHAVLVVGSEGVGIKQKTLELCDFRLSIPINTLCESLNASNAASVVMYEWNKQNTN